MSIQRTAHLDVLRGFVMVVMSIDHSRDFFQPTGLNPEDPNSASLLFFFIRWITHLCAPTFVLLAGASVPLAARSREPKQMRKLLLTRGLWLMFLECTWVTFSWYFDFRGIHLGILWGIGGAMVLMSLCSGLSTRLLGTVALLYLCAHPFLPDGDGLYNWLTKPQGFELLELRPISADI